MWRVVATTTAFAHKDPAARVALHSFLSDPARSHFGRFGASNGPSVESLIAETIRLYPPTRRISRETTASRAGWFGPRRAQSILVADVGALHRDTSIWGADADVYKPLRHHPDTHTSEQTQALLGFGMGRLKCVASGWAPQAAGVVVAVICEMLEDGVGVVEGTEVGGREGWEGWSVRFSKAG